MARATVLAAVVLLCDQLTVPTQQGFRRDDCRDFSKNATSEHLRLGCQPAALIVIQAELPVAELLSQYSILLAEVFDGVALLLA
ncbi:MAG TPA: hypothetical protein VFB63_20565 [Bryobacteraceae bacterium]|nr:hypothetical protein [Bryobacteraceae bacterium]